MWQSICSIGGGFDPCQSFGYRRTEKQLYQQIQPLSRTGKGDGGMVCQSDRNDAFGAGAGKGAFVD